MTYSHLVGIWLVGICWVTTIIVIIIVIITIQERTLEQGKGSSSGSAFHLFFWNVKFIQRELKENFAKCSFTNLWHVSFHPNSVYDVYNVYDVYECLRCTRRAEINGLATEGESLEDSAGAAGSESNFVSNHSYWELVDEIYIYLSVLIKTPYCI